MEVEIKYSIDDDTKVSEILEDELLTSLECEGTRRTLSMHAVYYDTEDGSLQKNGAAFRVRLEGDDYVATIKMGGSVSEGVHKRFEVNRTVDDSNFIENTRLDIFGDVEEIRNVLGDILDMDISSIMEMNYVRELFDVEYEQSRMEVALDQGDIWTDEGNAPICELEIEIHEGTVEDLTSLGGIICRHYGLRTESRSKFARGIELISK